MGEEAHAHRRFPEWSAFLLDNPIRRFRYSPEQLISKLGIDSNDVVVDFGCGPGFFSIPLARVAGKTIGVDVSPLMLERAARNAKKNHAEIELLQSNGTGIRLPDRSVDLILLTHVFHEVEDKLKVLSEFHRILRASGRLVVVEKTRGKGMPLSPPTIDEKELIHQIQQAGFEHAQTIPFEKDSIVIGKKAI